MPASVRNATDRQGAGPRLIFIYGDDVTRGVPLPPLVVPVGGRD
jgi:hypothetical protein